MDTPKEKNSVKAVFFDRDGTINSDEGHYYIYKPEDFTFNPGVIQGMKRLQDAGFLLFVITNQGGIAKGTYTHEDVARVHRKMCEELQQKGISLTKIYYCPHHDSIAPCNCRKPYPYFVNLAIDEYHLDKENCWFIGDSTRDIECALNAGIRPVKIDKNSDLTPVVDRILAADKSIATFK